MEQQTNIITFPGPCSKSASGQVVEGPRGLPSIIDFSSRRSASAAATADRATQKLTIGEVWDALNEGRLFMHYQPQYDIGTRETIGAEALVRLADRDGQLIGPHRFIEMTEQSDLIVPFGRAVIERVCADIAELRAGGDRIGRVSINLCANQLNNDRALPEYVDHVLDVYDLDYTDLEFELTERQNLGPFSDGMEVLRELARRGSSIVIDDFGIGYSSLLYLTELPISAFKLDRSLISKLPDDAATRSIVASLLSLADDLGLAVVAEGIETEAQNEYLAAAGCRFAQGFGYARPMPIADLRAFMGERTDSTADHAGA